MPRYTAEEFAPLAIRYLGYPVSILYPPMEEIYTGNLESYRSYVTDDPHYTGEGTPPKILHIKVKFVGDREYNYELSSSPINHSTRILGEVMIETLS